MASIVPAGIITDPASLSRFKKACQRSPVRAKMWNSHISNKLTENLVQYFFSHNETHFYIEGILRIECFENDRVTCVLILY